MFIDAAETLNFSEAARRACVTQSTLSLNIKQLEEEIHTPLFIRNSHEMSLTEVGQHILKYAHNVLSGARECEARVNDLIASKTGTLNIGITNAFVPITVKTLTEFSKLYPNVHVNLFQTTAMILQDMLLKRKVDIALGYHASKQTAKNIDYTPLFTAHVSVICKDTHPLAKKKSVKLKDLEQYSFLLPANNIRARRRLNKMMADTGIQLDCRMEMNLALPLLHMVHYGNFLTILSNSSLPTVELNDLVAVPIEEDGARLVGGFHALNDGYRKHSVDEFLRLIMKESIAPI